MRRRRPALSMTAAISAAVVGIALCAGTAAAVSDPAGTVETPVVLSSTHSGVSVLGSGQHGWAESGIASDPLGVRFVSASTHGALALDHPELIPDGSQFVSVFADHVLGLDANNALSAVDLATGHVSVNSAAAFTSFGGEYPVGATSVGWVVGVDDAGASRYYLQPFAGGAPTELVQPGDYFRVVSTSEAGVLVETLETVDVATVPTTFDRLRFYAADGASSRIVEETSDSSFPSALVSATTLAWVRGDGTIATQPVGGGSIVTHAAINADGWNVLAVAGSLISLQDQATGDVAVWNGTGDPGVIPATPDYFVDSQMPSALTNGTPAILVTLRDNWDQGLMQWFTSAAGPADTYQPPLLPLTVRGVTVTDGTVGYQRSADFGPTVTPTDRRTAPMFVRSVGGSPLAYGAETSYLTRASSFNGSFLSRASRYRIGFSLSGSRGAVATWPSPTATTQELTFLDKGVPTAGRPLPSNATVVSQSGPYTAVIPGSRSLSGYVALPNGWVVAVLPADLLQVVMDGPRAVYVTSDGAVWVRTVTQSLSATNPRQVLTPCGSATVSCARRIAVWGGTVAAATLVDDIPTGDVVTVGVTGGAPRTLTGITGATWVGLRGDLLGYTTEDIASGVRSIHLADLSVPSPAPILVADSGDVTGDFSLGGHLLSWSTLTTVKTATIPAGVDHAVAPRLLGMFGATTLGRTGAALTVPWTPQFDLDASITSWSLDIKQGSTVIRTLTGTGPTNAIRGISWDGKSTGGTIVAPGIYTWTLTGSNADGALTSWSGSGSPSGTLSVVTTVASRLSVSASAAAVKYGRSVAITGKLTKTNRTATPISSEPVQLYGRPLGAKRWSLIDTGFTSSKGLVTFRHAPTGHWQYTLRHPLTGVATASSSGNVSVLSVFAVSASWSASSIRHNRTLTVTGAIAPALSGPKVYVQRLVGKKWVSVAVPRAAYGEYTASFSVGKAKGTFYFRVVKPADATHLAAITAVTKVKVT